MWWRLRSEIGGGHIKVKHISQIHYNMNIGVTEPKYAILEDGSQSIVKLSHGPEGNLVLFNEYICYRMAMLIDIPMPHCGIGMMDEDTEILNPDIASSRNYGYAFYSTYIPKTTKLLPSIIHLMKNKDDFIKVLLFDHIIFNKDRNEGNLLVRFYKDDISLKVIDHTHVFINGAIWDGNCLKQAMSENDLLSRTVLEWNECLYSMFYRSMSITKEILTQTGFLFQNRISDNVIKNLLRNVQRNGVRQKKMKIF